MHDFEKSGVQPQCACGHDPSKADSGSVGKAACPAQHKQENACACRHNHCAHEHGHTDGCGCEHDHEHSHEDGCGCGHNHGHGHEDSCGCGHNHGHEDGCGCGHDHGAVPKKSELVKNGVVIAAAVALTVAAKFVPVFPVSLAMYLIAYVAVGREVLWTALQNIRRGKLFDENFLMAVATFGAFAIGDYAEAVAVMVFYNIGETLQGMAVAKSRASIAGLMDIRPEFARVEENGAQREVPPEQVRVGDVIVVKPGERIPLDCVVLQGESAVDASALTGESVPVAAAPQAALASGSVNLSGVLTCRVTSVFAQSTVQKILTLVSEASEKKAKAEKFITRFSKVYTPSVMAAAALIAVVPPVFTGFSTFGDWFYRGLIFLVVSCPCALVISVPVSFLGGIGGAAKRGVLVKGGDVIDLLAAPKAVVFDKTGTLTKGKFAVRSTQCAAGVSEAELLKAAALCERSSNHPIALSVRAFCAGSDSGAALDAYEEKAGWGVLATTGGSTFAAGNAKLMAHVGAVLPENAPAGESGTMLYVAKDGRYLGCFVIADEIKPGTADGIAQLRALGVERCAMLTGDNEATAARIAAAAGLDSYKAGLLPHEKVAAYEALTKSSGGVCLYAGDGINDAPLLARADVGVAMGGVGSDAAIEAADVVLMTDDVRQIADAVRVARRTRAIAKQNIAFSLTVKGIVLILAVFGYAPMWLAIFADVGVALLAVLNATRASQVK